MSAACHLERVALYTHGAVSADAALAPTLPQAVAVETCEYCASPQLTWRKCKQICVNCGQINRSCADL
ncbi:MAG: hypothetical protein IBJ03_07195 [Gemmatimonadaceae bacterium]|nr:hypothetical protein [Gemmatimonadaceae bacterium]